MGRGHPLTVPLATQVCNLNERTEDVGGLQYVNGFYESQKCVSLCIITLLCFFFSFFFSVKLLFVLFAPVSICIFFTHTFLNTKPNERFRLCGLTKQLSCTVRFNNLDCSFRPAVHVSTRSLLLINFFSKEPTQIRFRQDSNDAYIITESPFR